MQEQNTRPMQLAGLFYEKKAEDLQRDLQEFFLRAEEKICRKSGQALEQAEQSPQRAAARSTARIFLLPHAGHIYSGQVTADTLARIDFPRKLIILCPNHTGLGRHGAVWSEGAFATPLGTVPIAEELAGKLLAAGFFCADRSAHMREHSIEVILPFLQYAAAQRHGALQERLQIVPICLRSMDNLENMAKAIAMLMQEDEEIGLLISSDMNHFDTEKENKRKDFLALEALQYMQEQEFLQRIINYDISMCGVLGAYIAILAAKALGLKKCVLTSYDTSAGKSGDSSRVVGYAGLYFV